MKNYIIFGIVAVAVVAAAMTYKPGAQTTVTETANVQSAAVTEVAVKPVDSQEGVIINSKPITMEGGLIIEDTKLGTGAEAKKGSLVTVHYIGTFTNGQKFDASKDHGTEGFTFPIGQGMVIKGWDEGVVGMKVGGVRKLSVPPELGYGPNDYHQIPGNSTLLFEVELLAVRDK